MSSQRTLRRAVLAASLLVAFLSQGTWALAGVTGNIAGTVKDTNGAPIAGVSIRAVAPSQTASATTDAGGHFILLSLAPDTYTLDLTRDGYQPVAVPGTVVFADQTQQVALTMQRALKTIARVTSQAGAALVKSGVGGDLYSVNPATQQASVALGGGGSLDSMYSAIATTPGLVIGTGGMGWNQAVVVRGQNPWTTGFEYDGIPMNRAFDNYTSSTGSNLGLQELEVYTGGGPGSISSSGISGFINQVIKTGTFPGYGNLYGSVGTNPFYHSARVEAGGSTPDRTFSYYIGLSGYNQAFNYVDNANGAPYAAVGQPLGTYSCGNFCNSPAGPAIAPVCNLINSLPTNPLTDGCDSYSFAFQNSPNIITDRENVVNFHVGIPHPNGLRDDVQLMWSASALRTVWNNSQDQLGPGIQNWTALTTGLPYCPNLSGCSNKLSPLCDAIYGTSSNPTPPCPYNVPHYVDAITYNLPFGTNVAPGGKPLPYQWYYQPNSPQNRQPLAPLPPGRNDNNNNDEGIVKL
ncbi:MAG: carboxypeptidase regulatory-like domain-containing protein, partial [Candidatus Eremiobacteraeota bacterium]|nr:carboxypeptidase regulatory-like domain-containing protein [Candidatus Eremiobacteraeota bacterium]